MAFRRQLPAKPKPMKIAVSKENSPYAACDHAWATDDESIKGLYNHFSKENQFWAVEVKEDNKVVCFINFNGLGEKQKLDIGHVMNCAYIGNNYEYEALKALYNYAFIEYGTMSVIAYWALADEEKLAPLYKLGMKITDKCMENKFTADPDGTIS